MSSNQQAGCSNHPGRAFLSAESQEDSRSVFYPSPNLESGTPASELFEMSAPALEANKAFMTSL